MSTDRDAALASFAQRMKLERPLAFLDLETTGVSVENDRIVEIAVVKVLPSGDVEKFTSLVNPGKAIPESATAVHRICDADVGNAPSFATLAPAVIRLISGCDLAGFNVGKFDLKLLCAELARVGIGHDLSTARIVDAMAIYHRNERRDLTSAVRFYAGRDHDGHRAAVDVDATIDVLLAQLERYQSLPADIDGLADYCDGRQSDWLTSDGRIAWRDGAARITFGKHAGKSLQTLTKEEPDYLNWILNKDFPEDLKHLVAEAMDGKVPILSGPVAPPSVA